MYLFVEEAGEVIVIVRNLIVTFCSRKQMIRQTIHTRSKESYVLSKEPYVRSKEQFMRQAIDRACH